MKKCNTVKLFIILVISLVIITCSDKEEKVNIITGKDWLKVTDSIKFPGRSTHNLVIFQGKLWLIGGVSSNNMNDVWNSSDAIHWELVKSNVGFEITYGAKAVVFNDKIWVNTEKNIYSSSDGINWQKNTTVSGFPQYGKNFLVYKNKMWITGGWENNYRNDVWSSADGTNWEKVITKSCFPSRADHAFVVFQDKMWVIAGQNGINRNDIWYSEDGITWTSENSEFPSRHETQVIEYKNKLWLIAGFGAASNGDPILLSDLWNSSDGINWVKVNDTCAFGKLMEHAAIVFKNKIYVIGGNKGIYPNSIFCNDIWYSE